MKKHRPSARPRAPSPEPRAPFVIAGKIPRMLAGRRTCGVAMAAWLICPWFAPAQAQQRADSSSTASPGALLLLKEGRALLESGQPDAALERFGRARALDPASGYVHYWIGLAQEQR